MESSKTSFNPSTMRPCLHPATSAEPPRKYAPFGSHRSKRRSGAQQSEAADSDVPDFMLETDVRLLEMTQGYLVSRVNREASDARLMEAWTQFYGLYSELIRRFAISRGLRNSDVDDCVQDVWTEVARRLADFEHQGDRPRLRSWIYTVVRSKATDIVRYKIRTNTESLNEPGNAGRLPNASGDPAVSWERNWEAALLKTLLAKLKTQVSSTNFRVLYMRVFQHRSVTEVAAELGLTLEQVRYRKHRMVQKLRSLAAAYVGDE